MKLAEMFNFLKPENGLLAGKTHLKHEGGRLWLTLDPLPNTRKLLGRAQRAIAGTDSEACRS
jgi:hypothetical protein